jgi:hypothetical protein
MLLCKWLYQLKSQAKKLLKNDLQQQRTVDWHEVYDNITFMHNFELNFPLPSLKICDAWAVNCILTLVICSSSNDVLFPFIF